MNAILGGHIDLTDGNLTQRGKVEAGQLKFIAIATEKRNPEIPNIPTLKELGINVVFAVERGIVAPKGTPADILAKLEAACTQATKDPAFAESMKKQGTEVRYLDRKAYAEFFKKNDALNKDLARDLGLLKR
jgi:tripartite-type tricarboxylate transporter receptor subunit TctC